jgi:hypothetical protein
MARGKDKGRLSPFVPLLKDIDSPAWKVLSFGARSLYVALKRRVPPQRNTGYLSYRNAAKELGYTSQRKIGEWFKELEHYGFIVLHRHGCLGVEGRGKAPQWRLTELGVAFTDERPTRDFLRWDGVLFEPKRSQRTPGSFGCPQSPALHHPVVNLVMHTTGVAPQPSPMPTTGVALEEGSAPHVVSTTAPHVVSRVHHTSLAGFYFPSAPHVVSTSDGDEHQLACRLLGALKR